MVFYMMRDWDYRYLRILDWNMEYFWCTYVETDGIFLKWLILLKFVYMFNKSGFKLSLKF